MNMVPRVETTKDALTWVRGMSDAEAAAFVSSAVGGITSAVSDVYDVHPFAAQCLVGRVCERLSVGRAAEIDAEVIDAGRCSRAEVHRVLVDVGRQVQRAPRVLRGERNPDAEIAYAAGTGTPIRKIVAMTGFSRRDILATITYAWDEQRITNYWLGFC
ncbi:hypothetical protein [Corynebacterium bovis]|uniref:hypothetical protein n=1 Tax=Corynebacterium bovis TaxID=36808 RepID=UPI000F652182|nr:hypothetical protein [Corynebacterium bovis]